MGRIGDSWAACSVSTSFRYLVSPSICSFLGVYSFNTLGSTLAYDITWVLSIGGSAVVLALLFRGHGWWKAWLVDKMKYLAKRKLTIHTTITLAEMGLTYARGSETKTVVILCAIAEAILMLLGIYAPDDFLYICLLQSGALSLVLIGDRFQNDLAGIYLPLFLLLSVLVMGFCRKSAGFAADETLLGDGILVGVETAANFGDTALGEDLV